MDYYAYIVGWIIFMVGGGCAVIVAISICFYYLVVWINRASGEFWLVVDYHLNKGRYREWLATQPKRDRRAITFFEKKGRQP